MSPFGIGAKQVASVELPGEASVELPDGKVKVRYVEDREGRSTEHGSTGWRGPDESLAVTIHVDGREVPIKKPRMIGEGAGRGTIHKDLGSLELEGPARCQVRTQMAVDPGAHINPRIVFRA